jgi:signal transduction histidine kinase
MQNLKKSPYWLVLLGFALGCMAWGIDAIGDWLWFSNDASFVRVLFPAAPVELWMRTLVICICVVLGVLSQRVYNRQNRLMRELEDSYAALATAKKAAEVANQAKSIFLANVSHELRTPMHAVLSFAELGRDRYVTLSSEKCLQYFSSIHESGSRLLVLLNDLLDISKIEAGHMEYSFVPTDPWILVREVCDEARLLLLEKNLTIAFRGLTQDVTLILDRQRFRQIIRNLLSNAIKYSPRGSQICFEIDRATMGCAVKERGRHEAPAFAIRVLDEGDGIPEDEIEVIFEKFRQSNSTIGTGGAGLGLTITRELVTAHGGFVRASNRQDGGALFEILLPGVPA